MTCAAVPPGTQIVQSRLSGEVNDLHSKVKRDTSNRDDV